jgi:hypothetical protein
MDDQSLPWGECCLPSIWQERNCASHQIISYQIALPRIPRASTVSRERVAPVPTMGKPLDTTLSVQKAGLDMLTPSTTFSPNPGSRAQLSRVKKGEVVVGRA